MIINNGYVSLRSAKQFHLFLVKSLIESFSAKYMFIAFSAHSPFCYDNKRGIPLGQSHCSVKKRSCLRDWAYKCITVWIPQRERDERECLMTRQQNKQLVRFLNRLCKLRMMSQLEMQATSELMEESRTGSPCALFFGKKRKKYFSLKSK